MGLCVCSACNRHVRERSSVCPFCGAAFVAATAKCAEPSARTAAAAAIGAAVVLSGCSQTGEPVYGVPCASSCYNAGPDAAMDSGVDATLEAAVEAAPAEGSAPEAGTTTEGGTLQDAGAEADARGPADAPTDGQESGSD